MGCFLACFGLKNKKKNRKPRTRCISREQSLISYIPLDSDVLIKLHNTEKKISSDSVKLIEKQKLKKKKVSFNLDVKTYEPIVNEDDFISYLSDGEEETKWEFNPILHCEEDSILSSIQSYPPNNRYQNCRNSFDDEDEEELNYDDIYDIEEEEEEEDDDEEMQKQEDFCWNLNQEESDCEVLTDQMTEKDLNISSLKSNCNARDRGKYVFSVLNPVENLTQWKEIIAKATATATPLKREKENIMLEKQELITKHDSDVLGIKRNGRFPKVTVDSSLSNWLGFTENQKADIYKN